MRWVIEGDLREVQACVERCRDIVDEKKHQSELTQTDASREYRFVDTEIGEIGKIKLTVLPRGWTELYGGPSPAPTDSLLVPFLLQNVSLDIIEEPVRSLVRVYSWQIQQNIFDLTSDELYRLAYANKNVDWGWEKYGLGEAEKRIAALQGLTVWRDKIHQRLQRDFESIVEVIETEIRSANLAFTKWEGGQKVRVLALLDTKPGEPNGKPPRIWGFRMSVAKRVALAVYLIETDHISQRSAATKSKTSTRALNIYWQRSEVQDFLAKFKNSPAEADQFRASLHRSKRQDDSSAPQ